MNDSTHTPDAEPALTAPLDAYEAQSALYDRLEDETTTRNKAAVFDALAKAGISIVTITFDGSSDSGQVEDVQATAQDAPIALPSDQIEYEHIRWGDDRANTKLLPAPRRPRRSCFPLPRNDPRWLGERRWGLWRIHLRYRHPLDCPRL